MRVQFWGTRGSVPSPGPATARYGGNTSCVTVRADNGTLIILDCGTGARPLGLSLLGEKKPLRAHMLIGHTHWDHIQGLPFFIPAFLPDTELTIHAPASFEQSLAESLAGQMQHSYFPLALQELRSRLVLHDLEEGTFTIDGVTVETHYLNHTAPTLGYRITAGGVTIVYATDHEPYWHGTGGFVHPGDRDHIAFLRGADLLIHDAQYTLEEYAAKVSWGHSTIPYVTEVAMEAGVKRLALFHHDPSRDDAAVARLEAQAQAMAAARQSPLEVFAAAEGQDLDIAETALAASPPLNHSAFRRASVAGARILVAISDAERTRLVSNALTKDRFELILAADGQAALSEAMLHRPDMVVVEARLPGLDGSQLIQALRLSPSTERVPVLMITSSLADKAALRGLMVGATDCLAEPLSVPMLRFRVRMWLLRSSQTNVPQVGASDNHHSSAPQEVPPDEAVEEVFSFSAGLEARMARRARLLADLPLFRGLPPEQLLELARQATEGVFAPGADIIRQGEPGDALYVIISGQVSVRAARPGDGPEALLGTLGPGAVFGEMALVDDGPRSATVRAQARTRCVILRRTDFLAGLTSSTGLARALLLTLSNRLREADLLLARDAPDPVTGLMSRQAFEEYFERETALAQQRSSSCAVQLVWGDWPASGGEGHPAEVEEAFERALADAVRRAVRSTDIVAHWDARRLVVLLTEWVHRDTRPVVARIQRNFRDLIKERGLPNRALVRFGEVVLTGFGANLADVIEEAQAAAVGGRDVRR